MEPDQSYILKAILEPSFIPLKKTGDTPQDLYLPASDTILDIVTVPQLNKIAVMQQQKSSSKRLRCHSDLINSRSS